MVRHSFKKRTEILRLTIFDVKRGEAREIPLRFIELHGRLQVLYSAAKQPEWVSVATESAVVRWHIGHQSYVGTANLARNSQEFQAEVLRECAATFGGERTSRWFGQRIGCMTLLSSPEGTPYHHELEALFDRSAPQYDWVVHGNRFDEYLRKVALEALRKLFTPGERVLELGCGTGLETIPLAEAGVNVVALDISSKMLEELNRKSRASSPRGRIETHQARLADLPKVVDELGPGSFDGAFSHFGALNTEPQIEKVPPALHRLVKPNGKISLGGWNRTCLAEMVLFGIGLRPERALARFHASAPIGSSRFGIPVFPYGPGEVKRLFSPLFAPVKSFGVSVFVPPYDLGKHFNAHSELISLLEVGDRLVRDLPLFRYLGDHFLLELRRRENGASP